LIDGLMVGRIECHRVTEGLGGMSRIQGDAMSVQRVRRVVALGAVAVATKSVQERVGRCWFEVPRVA
jgi:hypothetical protein